jgi:hypothetical protein
MSLDHILNKLAEKHILAGNKDFAYRLVEASEKECAHCGSKSAEIMKRKGKHTCPKCAKETKCALKGCEAKMMYAEMHKQGGKAYCCKDCAKADKMKKTALDDLIQKYAKTKEEYVGYYGGAKCEKCEDNKASGECKNCGKLMCKDCKGSEGKCKGCSGKKTSSLEVLLNKYAGIEDLKKWQAENRKGKKASVCPDCGKKKCECSTMTSCAGSSCKSKMQKRHMHLAGGKHYCCATCAGEHMDKKAYASDHSGHYHSAIEELDGHLSTMSGDSNNPVFVFDSKEALEKAQGIVPVFLGREVDEKDGKHMLKVTGPKKEALNAGDLLRKYAEDLDPYTSANPEMVGYRNEQMIGEMGHQPTREEEREYAEMGGYGEESNRDDNPYEPGSEKAMIWSQGYQSGYDAVYRAFDSFSKNDEGSF